MAAKEKRMGDKTGDARHYDACLEHLKHAVTNFAGVDPPDRSHLH